MRAKSIAGWSVMTAVCAGAAGTAEAAVNVWVDFNANWIAELDQATADAGVTVFDASERGLIQSNILSQIQSNYSGYLVNFSLSDPGGVRDRINFGYNETDPGAGSGVLGFAPLHVG